MLRDWTDSASLDGMSAEGERLFTRLIMKADDYGRFHADPRLVRALCFPLSDTVKSDTVRKWLDELHTAGLIYRYEVGGKPFLAIVNFGQRLKQSRAKFPEPEGELAEWLPTSGNFREGDGSSGLKTNRIRKENEHEHEGDSGAEPEPDADGAGAPSAFDRFWSAYPRKEAKANAQKAWPKAIAKCPIEKMIAAVEAAKISEKWIDQNGRFIPHPASWLNGERWNDQISLGQNGTANGYRQLA